MLRVHRRRGVARLVCYDAAVPQASSLWHQVPRFKTTSCLLLSPSVLLHNHITIAPLLPPPSSLTKQILTRGYPQHNSEYIIIKKYIDNDFQDELFRHTKMLKEKKTIASGYVKDTEVTTTLRPREKSSDQMYLVRSKSRSRGGSGSGTGRKSWMFT